VEVRFTKWGGIPHWRFTLERLGTDRYGLWLAGRTGIPLRRGDEPPIAQPHDFVMLIPAAGDWTACWNADAGSTDIAVYADVTTRPEVGPDTVRVVDLDLDVVRRFDGAVAVLDEDEFAEHQVRYGYPAEIIEQARATTDRLVAALAANTEPFGAVGSAWLRRL
jgi:hypothetical protein